MGDVKKLRGARFRLSSIEVSRSRIMATKAMIVKKFGKSDSERQNWGWAEGAAEIIYRFLYETINGKTKKKVVDPSR